MKNYTRGLWLVAATGVISGVSVGINKFGSGGIDVGLFTALKNSLVGLVFVGLIVAGKEWSHMKRLTLFQWVKLIGVGLIGGSVPFVLFFRGLQLTSGLKAGFIHDLMFMAVAALAFIFLKERISRRSVAALVAMLGGLVVFLNFRPQALAEGDVYIGAATMLWAGEIVLSKYLLKNIRANIVAGSRMLFGGMFIWLYVAWQGSFVQLLHFTGYDWLWVIVTTVFLVGYVYTFYHGLAYVPAHVASTMLTVALPVSLLLTAGFNQTAMVLPQAVGMFIMVVGCWWLLRKNAFVKTTYGTHAG